MRWEKTRNKLCKAAGAAVCFGAILSSIPMISEAAEGYSWHQEANGVRYVNASGESISPGWQQIGGDWYFIEDTGYPHMGWLKEDGHWYYLTGTGAMATGWMNIDGKYYHFKNDGSMENGIFQEGDTVYSFNFEMGNLAYAKKAKNTGGGGFTISFYNQKCQELADSLNELKADDFDGDEKDDYYEDDKKNYDKDASFIINGRLTEIAEHRLSMARTKGYGSGRIPGEGKLEDYLKAVNYNSSRRIMETYLINCDGATQAEDKLLRNHGEEEKKRKDRIVYYKEIGIAHESVNGKDYYMVVFMR